MPRRKKGPLVLTALKTGTLFKIAKQDQIEEAPMTLDGVYRIATARADHGRSIRIYDLAGMRLRPPGSIPHNHYSNRSREDNRGLQDFKLDHYR